MSKTKSTFSAKTATGQYVSNRQIIQDRKLKSLSRQVNVLVKYLFFSERITYSP